MAGADVRVVIAWPSRRLRLLLYGAVPFVLLGGLVAAYYSDVGFLRGVVSPEIDWLTTDSQREFGLLESLENVALLALAVVAGIGLWRKQLLAERVALWALLTLAVLMLLEETDYGLHYVELIGGGTAAPSDSTGYHNVHRIGYVQVVLHELAKFGMLTFFGAFAIVFARSRRPVLRYLAPDRWSVLTILLVTALQELVWRLAARAGPGHGTLTGNEIEFTELGMYYLALLYAVDMVFWRRYEPA